MEVEFVHPSLNWMCVVVVPNFDGYSLKNTIYKYISYV